MRYIFVTHNVKDFSISEGDRNIPHPDIAQHFSRFKSKYFINLTKAIHSIHPEIIPDMLLTYEWRHEPRSLSDIDKAENEMVDKIWFARHQYRLFQVNTGKIKIIEKKDYNAKRAHKEIIKNVWQQALKVATKIEKKYGSGNVGPWGDFEWGMMNGKLSALRWVMGDTWDDLDT